MQILIVLKKAHVQASLDDSRTDILQTFKLPEAHHEAFESRLFQFLKAYSVVVPDFEARG